MGKTYVVFVGRNPGIYRSWKETHMQVNKFSGAVHKSYKTSEEAVSTFTAYNEKQSGSSSTTTSASSSTTVSSSTKPEQHDKLAKLIDAQLELAHEQRKQCLKAAGIFEEIEQQLKALRVKEDIK